MLATKSGMLLVLVAVAALVAAGGCFFPGVPATLTELPPELQAVVDDPNHFTPPTDDPLADTTPGTIIDDLSGLTGCWGTYSPGKIPEAGPPYDVFYEVYQFDVDSGTANRWVFSAAWVFVPPMVVIDEGRLTVLDEGRIEVRIDRWTVIDMSTAMGAQFTDIPQGVAVQEKLVTLDEDQLLLATPSYVDEDTGEPIGRIFTRFDCPQ